MSRGSFSRSVARAAASGGGHAYRTRRPLGWYGLMALICVVGITLVVYSRNERLHPTTKPTEGPSATDVWQAALGVDICGKVEPALGANTNLSTVGIRTFGNGLINVDPSAATTPANFEGAKATLGLFVKNYSGLTLSASSIKLPGKTSKLLTNGALCGKTPGILQTEVWSSPNAKGRLLGSDPTKLHLTNGEMITLAFAPRGAVIPEPASKAALITALGGTSSSTSSSTTSSTTPSTTSSSSTTVAHSTTTTSPRSTTTTRAKSTATTLPRTTTT